MQSYLVAAKSSIYSTKPTIDKSGANTAALTTLNADKPEEETITVRQNKYLNNLVEHSNRFDGHRRSWPVSN